VTDSQTDSPNAAARPLTVVVNDAARAVAPDRLRRLVAAAPGAVVLVGGEAPHDLAVETLPAQAGPWWRWLGAIDVARRAEGLVVIDAGLALPERFFERLGRVLDTDEPPPLIALPGNHEDALNPAAGLPSPPPCAVMDRIAHAASAMRWCGVAYVPRRLAVIPAGRLDAALEAAAEGRCSVLDAFWIHDPTRALDAGDHAGTDLCAALAEVRTAFIDCGEEGLEALPPLFGVDGRAVVLHISHDWGGGIARWIGDIAATDDRRRHLVLSSAGRTDGVVHGQQLKLYAAGPGRGLVRSWTLAPSIAATSTRHAGYREIVDWVLQRFGVGQLVISSLIGHSLEILETGLPTVQMLHDYYPAWPVLDSDPLAFTDEAGAIDLDAAISARATHFLFADRRGEHWRRLAADWLERVRANDVALAAPTRHVLERWRQLVGEELAGARIIPHGFSGWPDEATVDGQRPLPDGRLNLVVVGRLSAGKGLALLEQALPGLRPHARITLLGCGHHGMRLFGRADVDIILDYAHDRLPEQLRRIGPQAVLFLSTVPETWNYVLSETRALGLVPIATCTGSFIERIEHRHDGLLFEPTPEALVETIADLHRRPDALASMRAALPAEPGLDEALTALSGLLQPLERQPAPPAAASAAFIERARRQDIASEQRLRLERWRARREKMEAELDERTAWARKQERLADERTQWALRLQRDVDRQSERIEAQQRAIEERERRLDEAMAHIESLERDLDGMRRRVEQLDDELATVYASRSWRLTRPMRAANRVLANARRRRAYNPLNWPRLLARLVHNLRLYGLRGTLMLMQQGEPVARAEPPSIAPEVVEPDDSLEPVRVSAAAEPDASLIIPVFNKVRYTAACLRSLAEHAGSRRAFEVIVVDDRSSDETETFLAACEGIRVIRNPENAGFIESCNAGARAARGRHLVFLNNDTTVTAGWLDALLETFETFPDTGVVGARLVYPDGRLQEAGGIVFSDASGWNYGRGDQPDRPAYSFACEADYVSGACLAIATDTFRALDGFDRHYAPAYYEDTDLCFRVRERGLRVIYQPACTIIHHEGVSSGTDESSGTKRFQAINRDKFAARWRQALAGQPDPVPGPEALEAIEAARHHRARGVVVVIDAVTPEPDKDSGSMRMLGLLCILRDLGYRVRFVAENLAWVERYTADLQRRGVEVVHHPWASRIEDALGVPGDGPDWVICSRYYVLGPLMKTIRSTCPRARVVFDTVDLHYLREQRMAELAGDAEAMRRARRTRDIELGVMRRSDATLVVSPAEKDLLAEAVPEVDVHILSNIHRVHGRTRDFGARADVMFVGGFQHPPNLDAAEWLIDAIMPRVREELPDVRLHLIGSRMPERLRETRADGVVVHGFVEQLEPFLEGCRLSLAPLRYGAGVKGKVNQAMAWGLPVVATTCAAEGMYLNDGEDVLIADTAEDFAEAVVRAYSDEALWRRLSDGGLANVERHFSFQAARRAISELLASLSES
jgi:GT2 family glycosyltransferase/glycosyltransferase involved in cell wall biosynthesis